jgi:serine-type D-Ala-D-Ala carboxypeptidase/endopeptidase (penicillin-binding protein 4)
MARRLLLPALLSVAAVLCGVQAWRADAAFAPELNRSATVPPVGATTPVMSVRRAPAWLQRPTADAALAATLAPIVAASPADTCLVVRDSGRTVYAHNPALALVPASTVKLVTAFAALERLGPTGTLVTTAVSTSAPVAGVIAGNLWIVGGGDPLLATKDYVDRFGQPQPFTDVATLVERIAAAGITQIRGDIIGDESRYDTRRYVASWDPSFITGNESGPLSAFTLNDGFAAYPNSKFSTGAVPAEDPAQRGAAVIRDLLAKRGIRVVGTARSGTAPTGTVEVARTSVSITDVVTQMLTMSDNLTAELLTKELGVRAGAEGSTSAGVTAVRQALSEAGLAVSAVSLLDGSGLDRANRLTCDFLATLLDEAGPASPIATSLPVAAKSGTLAERFIGTAAAGRLRAKTGSLRNTRSGNEPRTITFAYIANHPTLNAEANLRVQDQLGVALVTYPSAPTLAVLGPAAG